MASRETETKRRRGKKDGTDYDTYVANVSNGMNPPSQRKRRKKKPDPDAYDQYLEENRSEDERLDKLTNRRAEEEGASPRRAARESAERAPKKRAKKRSARRRDGYDEYLSDVEKSDAMLPRTAGEVRAAKRRAKNRKKRVTPLGILYCAAMVALLAGAGVLVRNQLTQYDDFKAMRAVVDGQSFYEGTTVDGLDVSGMTLAQAEEYFDTGVEPMYRNRAVSLTTGEMYLAEQLGYTSNFRQVLRAAFQSGRSGTLRQRYEAITSDAHAAVNYVVSRTFYTDETIRQAVSELAERQADHCTEPSVSGFDPETKEFIFQEGNPGHELDQERLVSDIEYVMENGGGSVEAVVYATVPEVSIEDIMNEYGEISFVTTSAATSKPNRIVNLTLACQAINGYRLDPGEEFSFNAVVGKRTEEKGYKEAGVYASGTAASGIGGGVCQVASTLFDAAVMADMTITKRKPHSLPVHYLDKGLDAAINWPNKDLCFVNKSDDPVYIYARVTPEKTVQCGIYGKYLPNGITISMEARTTSSQAYETVYKVDKSLAKGATKVVEGHKGYKATTWKIVKDADGNEISREVLCYSKYPKGDTVVYYNP